MGGQKFAVCFEEIALLLVILLLVYICPYSKVEESFNTQASHDILYFGQKISLYDHLDFPGVVPRTFIGPLVLTSIVYPFHLIWSVIGAPRFYRQLAIRSVLGLLNWLALVHLKRSLSKSFGNRVAVITFYMMLAQFHTLFYVSRTLPNSFAFGLVILGIAEWINNNCYKSLFIITVSAIVFRCDMIILLAPLGLTMLLSKQVSFVKGMLTGIISVLFSLATTVSIDSYFWGGGKQLVWPEGTVLFFNSIENRSSEWGVSPFHWYFSSALPKSLLLPLIFLPLSFISFPQSLLDFRHYSVDWKIVQFSTPIILFLLLYSVLPHKELRFILPVLPLLTFLCANGANKIMTVSSKWIQIIATSLVFCTCFASALIVWFIFVPASMNNYYGGDALRLTNEIFPHNEPLWVHIDGSACMTGVTRFLEEGRGFNWQYSKNETISTEEIQSATHCDKDFCGFRGGYDVLITSTPALYTATFSVEREVFGFDASRMSLSHVLHNPLRAPISSKLFIMRRN